MKTDKWQKFAVNILLAVVFGFVFWAFLESIQPIVVNKIYGCVNCGRCSNILYNKEQRILAACAGLAFAGVSLFNVKGWQGILKTIAVSLFCFQIFTFLVMWQTFTSQECNALRQKPAIIVFIELPVTSAICSLFCSLGLMAYYAVRRTDFQDNEDFQELN